MTDLSNSDLALVASTVTGQRRGVGLTREIIEDVARKLKESAPAGPANFRLMPNFNLTVPGPDQIVERTLKERLFTRPWRPLQKTRTIKTFVPDPKIYMTGTPEIINLIGYPAVFGHPETLRRFQDSITKHMAGDIA